PNPPVKTRFIERSPRFSSIAPEASKLFGGAPSPGNTNPDILNPRAYIGSGVRLRIRKREQATATSFHSLDGYLRIEWKATSRVPNSGAYDYAFPFASNLAARTAFVTHDSQAERLRA
ncbi:MAG TPA: hypothetical protein PKD54_08940, partial [Pirellulaceae bacterium]|nr:hypothetical protein [Pirellulaceae bacterium]